MSRISCVMVLSILIISSYLSFAAEPGQAPGDDETPEYKQILEREKIAPPRGAETTMTLENGFMREKESGRAQEKEQERAAQDEVVEFYSPNWYGR